MEARIERLERAALAQQALIEALIEDLHGDESYDARTLRLRDEAREACREIQQEIELRNLPGDRNDE